MGEPERPDEVCWMLQIQYRPGRPWSDHTGRLSRNAADALISERRETYPTVRYRLVRVTTTYAVEPEESDSGWPRRAWDLGLLHKGGDPHYCPACLKQPEPPKDFICPAEEANAVVLANPQPAEGN